MFFYCCIVSELILAVSNLENLYRAWRDVRSHVSRTSWQHVTSEMNDIDASPLRVLNAIQVALHDNTYQFSQKHGYTKRKSGGSRRGITIHSVRDRIIQRAILNVLHTTDTKLKRHLGDIPSVHDRPTSFAGIPGKGVPEAIAYIVDVIREGGKAYVYSDMKDFFPCSPRTDVVDFISSNVNDDRFANLFQQALNTELSNAHDLGDLLALFPGPEIGVAQGSLLSVLAGNIAMRRFDEILNTKGFVTVRYLDDFITMTTDIKSADRAFDVARTELARLGMDCYAPNDGSQKAFKGLVSDGFDFLGCRIHPDGVSPSSKTRRKFLREIKSIIVEAKKEIRSFQSDEMRRRRTEQTYIQALSLLDRKIRGWGDAYQFVSNRVVFSQMDDAINEAITDFHQWFARQTKNANPRVKRRMLGAALLADTPPKIVSEA